MNSLAEARDDLCDVILLAVLMTIILILLKVLVEVRARETATYLDL